MKEIIDIINKIRTTNPRAADFLTNYIHYCSLVDDCVDERYCDTRMRSLTEFAFRVYNSEYWKQYAPALTITDRLMNNSYFDSLEWENAESWKKEYSKFMAQCGNQMILAVLIIEYGEQAANEVSLTLREAAYEKNEKD